MKGFLSESTVLKVVFPLDHQNIPFAGVYVFTFQPGNFTGWGSEGVKRQTNKTEKIEKNPPQKPRMFTELIYDHWGVTQDAEPSPIHLITTIRHFSGDRAYVLCPVVSSRGLVR